MSSSPLQQVLEVEPQCTVAARLLGFTSEVKASLGFTNHCLLHLSASCKKSVTPMAYNILENAAHDSPPKATDGRIADGSASNCTDICANNNKQS